MSDLISREAVLKTLTIQLEGAEDLRQVVLSEVSAFIQDQPAIKPQVACNITGGVLQGASSDYPVDVYILDFDLDCVDCDAVGIEIDGDLCYLGQESAQIDPDFLERVVAAPEVYLHDGSPVEDA